MTFPTESICSLIISRRMLGAYISLQCSALVQCSSVPSNLEQGWEKKDRGDVRKIEFGWIGNRIGTVIYRDFNVDISDWNSTLIILYGKIYIVRRRKRLVIYHGNRIGSVTYNVDTSNWSSTLIIFLWTNLHCHKKETTSNISWEWGERGDVRKIEFGRIRNWIIELDQKDFNVEMFGRTNVFECKKPGWK